MGDTLTEQIIGAAIEVHKELGPGLLESIYENALCCELEMRHIPCERQVNFDVKYKGTCVGTQRLDVVIDRQVVVELKSLARLPDVATAQVLSQLRACGLKRALILNFGEARLIDGVRRISL